MAFRDASTALREQLELERRRTAALEAKNAELTAKHSPLVRTLALSIGVVVVLAAGLAWHLAVQNHGLEQNARRDAEQARLLREELDRAMAARTDAENAAMGVEAACRERNEIEISRARRRTRDAIRAAPAAAPTVTSPSRTFWVRSARGRDDIHEGDPCLLTLNHEILLTPDEASCGLEVRCGFDDEVELVSARRVACIARHDGWANLSQDDGILSLSMRGPQLGVRDEADTWQVMLSNERPCL